MRSLRHFSAVIALALLATGAASATLPTPKDRIMQLSADRIAFYYDRFLIEATGHVRITTGDGLTVTGTTMTMDLKNNRFMVAGSVHLDSPNGTQDGAALADFMDFNRVYFVPITSEPDRWTFENGDYTHPIKGREMPGDTFAFPDLTNNDPYLYARRAVIGERRFVRFERTVLTAGRMEVLPAPTYYINFSADPKLSENSLAGANFDATWQFAGNQNSISAAHIRYDQQNKAYVSFEQHFASKKAYAVFSINPLTKASKFYDLVTDYQPGARSELHTFSQLHTVQSEFKMPEQAQHVTSARFTQAFKVFSASLTYQSVNYCLLQAHNIYFPGTNTLEYAQACGTGTSLVGEPISTSHPQQWALDFSSLDFPKRSRFPVKFRLRAGLGFIHDACTNADGTTNVCLTSLQVLGGVVYRTIYQKYVGASAYLPSVKLGNKNDPRKTYYLNASMDGQRSYYSVPHHVDSLDTNASISRIFGNQLTAYLSYGVRQISDLYNTQADRDAQYPPNNQYTNPNFISFESFVGSATFRTLAFGANFAPNPDFTFALLARKHDDFPIAVPGLFSPPPLNVLGQYVSPNFLGQPPYDITGDLRVKVLHHYYLDISRTYYFNFGDLKWSPSFVIQVTQ